jgi:hypothetical protein
MKLHNTNTRQTDCSLQQSLNDNTRSTAKNPIVNIRWNTKIYSKGKKDETKDGLLKPKHISNYIKWNGLTYQLKTFI